MRLALSLGRSLESALGVFAHPLAWIPLSLAIADTDKPCRSKSSIIIIPPILTPEIPLPTTGRSIIDHAPPRYTGEDSNGPSREY